MERVLVVGAGQAGLQLAASLRQKGFAGEIMLIGDEASPPYQRPPLSKAYLEEGREESFTCAVPLLSRQSNRFAMRPSRPVGGSRNKAGAT